MAYYLDFIQLWYISLTSGFAFGPFKSLLQDFGLFWNGSKFWTWLWQNLKKSISYLPNLKDTPIDCDVTACHVAEFSFYFRLLLKQMTIDEIVKLKNKYFTKRPMLLDTRLKNHESELTL